MRILVVYASFTGHTKKAAELIAEGAKRKGVEVVVKKIEDTRVRDIKKADVIALGCPTRFFSAARKMKQFMQAEETKKALRGKKGVIFTSCMLIPGAIGWLRKIMQTYDMPIEDTLVVHGSPKGTEIEACKEWGGKIAKLPK
jgi:flavorubredoxin